MPTGDDKADTMRSRVNGDLTAIAVRLQRITVRILAAGMGSGVIWSSGGLIVTNAHVTRGRAGIVLPSGRSLEGRLLGWVRFLASVRRAAAAVP